MASIYTRRIAAGTGTAGGDVILYTVPAGTRLIVRDLVLGNGTATAADLIIYMAVPGPQNVVIFHQSVPPGTATHVDMRQAVNPGETLHIIAPAGAMSWSLTGYFFSST